MSRVTRSGYEWPEVSICIPTLAYDDRMRQTEETIRERTAGCFEIVVVDCQGELRGWTAPQNEAMHVARGLYLVAMNDDVLVSDGWLSPLIKALQDGAWCATPDQTHVDGPQVFAPYCMAWTLRSWLRIGSLDERFRLWGSDIDIARRLADAGHPPVKVKLPTPIEHVPGRTTSQHSEALREIIEGDMQRFEQKWGISAEDEKHRLAALYSA